MHTKPLITLEIVQKLIKEQFPQYTHLSIESVEQQGHDNRTYRLGDNMLIRLPSAERYALKVVIEQELLPHLVPHLSIAIPVPLAMGHTTEYYPYHFSLYKWITGKSLNFVNLIQDHMQQLAGDGARFLKELQSIKNLEGPTPGLHNFWRGAHISVYDQEAQNWISKLSDFIDVPQALKLMQKAYTTEWHHAPVWIHGDMAPTNILIDNDKLSAVIDFGGMAVGDPACDLVIAWTIFEGEARTLFIDLMNMDEDTWLRAKAWCLWKAAFELYHTEDKKSKYALKQIKIIQEVLQ